MTDSKVNTSYSNDDSFNRIQSRGSYIPQSLEGNENDAELGINNIKNTTSYNDFRGDSESEGTQLTHGINDENFADDNFTQAQDKTRCFRRMVHLIDDIDQFYSGKIHRMNNRVVESLVYGPAQAFNRYFGPLNPVLAFIVGFFCWSEMLSNLGYKSDYPDITNGQRARLATCFGIFYALCLIFSVSSTQFLKYTIKRQRPLVPKDTIRWTDLRSMEKGTYAMPSGDSGAGGVFCMVMFLVPGLTWCLAFLPLVMLGRVYYHCHWLGDTICGVSIGCAWSFILFCNFEVIASFMQLISGPEFFVTGSS